MRKSSRSRAAVALLIILSFSSLCACGVEESIIPKDYILAAPAHVAESNYPGYVKVYEDTDRDLALYLDTEYEPTLPDVGTHVSSASGAVSGTVSEQDTYYFYFIPDDGVSIMKGDSGLGMYVDGAYVGYISSIDMSGRVKVICY